MSNSSIVIVNNQDEIIGCKERGSLSLGDIYLKGLKWVVGAL
jgi:hypothetical protein